MEAFLQSHSAFHASQYPHVQFEHSATRIITHHRESACRAAVAEAVKPLVEALELAINDLEGYEDGAPDASPISKHINALLAEIRPALRDHATKQGKGEAS
jgi:uncharacterized membrane protein YccC